MEFSVITWNIAEGSLTETLPPNSTIPDIAKALALAAPDFVLLNEVKNWDGPFGWAYGGMNQAGQLAHDLGMGYQIANVNVTGLT